MFEENKKTGQPGGAVAILYGVSPAPGGERFVMNFDSSVAFLSFDEESLVKFIGNLQGGLETIRELRETRAAGGASDAAH